MSGLQVFQFIKSILLLQTNFDWLDKNHIILWMIYNIDTSQHLKQTEKRILCIIDNHLFNCAIIISKQYKHNNLLMIMNQQIELKILNTKKAKRMRVFSSTQSNPQEDMSTTMYLMIQPNDWRILTMDQKSTFNLMIDQKFDAKMKVITKQWLMFFAKHHKKDQISFDVQKNPLYQQFLTLFQNQDITQQQTQKQLQFIKQFPSIFQDESFKIAKLIANKPENQTKKLRKFITSNLLKKYQPMCSKDKINKISYLASTSKDIWKDCQVYFCKEKNILGIVDNVDNRQTQQIKLSDILFQKEKINIDLNLVQIIGQCLLKKLTGYQEATGQNYPELRHENVFINLRKNEVIEDDPCTLDIMTPFLYEIGMGKHPLSMSQKLRLLECHDYNFQKQIQDYFIFKNKNKRRCGELQNIVQFILIMDILYKRIEEPVAQIRKKIYENFEKMKQCDKIQKSSIEEIEDLNDICESVELTHGPQIIDRAGKKCLVDQIFGNSTMLAQPLGFAIQQCKFDKVKQESQTIKNLLSKCYMNSKQLVNVNYSSEKWNCQRKLFDFRMNNVVSRIIEIINKIKISNGVKGSGKYLLIFLLNKSIHMQFEKSIIEVLKVFDQDICQNGLKLSNKESCFEIFFNFQNKNLKQKISQNEDMKQILKNYYFYTDKIFVKLQSSKTNCKQKYRDYINNKMNSQANLFKNLNKIQNFDMMCDTEKMHSYVYLGLLAQKNDQFLKGSENLEFIELINKFNKFKKQTKKNAVQKLKELINQIQQQIQKEFEERYKENKQQFKAFHQAKLLLMLLFKVNQDNFPELQTFFQYDLKKNCFQKTQKKEVQIEFKEKYTMLMKESVSFEKYQ